MKRIVLFAILCLSALGVQADIFGRDKLRYETMSDNTVAIISGVNATGDVVIPKTVNYQNKSYTVTTIKSNAFANNTSIKSVTTPISLKKIEWGAFMYCGSLRSVTLQEGLEQIDLWTFSNCSSLETVALPSTLKVLGPRVFDTCNKLNHIVIPDSIRTIGYLTFNTCESLTDIILPKGLEVLEKQAFRQCYALENIVLPEGLTNLGDGVFERCTALQCINIPKNVIKIGEVTLSGCINLSAITIDEFNPCYDSRENCNAIIETETGTLLAGCKSTIIPSSITAIASKAFWGMEVPQRVIVPEGTTSIGAVAFCSCQNLTNLILPASLQYVGMNAFASCNSLSDIYCYATKVPQMERPINGETELSNVTLHVPAESVELYKNADQWKNALKIVSLSDEPGTYHPFIDNGKLWNTGIMADDEFLKQYEYRFYGDTIINGRRCMELKRSTLMTRQYGGTQPIDTIYVGALYEEDQKVYCAFPGQQEFELLYDFASPVGSDVEIRGEQFTIVRKEMSQEPGFKGNCTYLQLKGQTDAPLLCWMEGIGNLSNPLAPLFYRHSTDFQDEVLLFCSILPDEIIYLKDESLPSNIEVKKQWLDFTHTTKPRPKAPRNNSQLTINNSHSATEEENLTGEYSAKELFVNMNSLSGTYNVALTDAIGNEVYRKEVQTNNIVALNTDLTKYAEGTYTLTVENSEEQYTATLSLPLIDNAVRDLQQTLNSKPSTLNWTDLSGRRLTTTPTQKGVYVKEGRKVMVK